MYGKIADRLERLDKYIFDRASIQEIFSSNSLLVFLVICFFYIVDFTMKIQTILGEKIFTTHCHSFVQNCTPMQNLFFLNEYIYLRPLFFIIIGTLFFLSIYCFHKKKYGLLYFTMFAEACLSIFPMIVLTNSYNLFVHHQEHYMFYFLLIIFFVWTNRKAYLTLFYALTYFTASIPKFTSLDWLLGNVLSVYVPKILLPFAQNFTILVQIFSIYFLLYGTKAQRILFVVLLEGFHIYTFGVSMVSFSFFWVTIPFLFYLFVADFEPVTWQKIKSSYAGMMIILLFIFLSTVRLFIFGNDFYTREGSAHTFNMFNSSIGCKYVYASADPKIFLTKYKSGNDCDPFAVWSSINSQCKSREPRSLILSMKNKYQNYELVNTDNYCSLEYSPFLHNSWVKTDDFSQDIDETQFSELEKNIFQNREFIEAFYLFLFFMAAILSIRKFFVS